MAGAKWSSPTAMQRFEAFMVWLAKNEATEEQKNEIVESINFEEFSVEELMTSVRNSGLYSGSKIDKRVLQLFKDLKETKDFKIRQLEDTLENTKNYMNPLQFKRFSKTIILQ